MNEPPQSISINATALLRLETNPSSSPPSTPDPPRSSPRFLDRRGPDLVGEMTSSADADPPLTSRRRRPPPPTAADAVHRDTRRSAPSDAPDEASAGSIPQGLKLLLVPLTRPPPDEASKGKGSLDLSLPAIFHGLKFLLVPNGSDGFAPLASPETSLMFSSDGGDPRSDLMNSALFFRKIIEFIGRHAPSLQIPPVVGPPTRPVPPPLFSSIQNAYKELSDAVKSFGLHVKTLSESFIKNPQSIKALEKRLDKLEEKVEESLRIAKSALETAKESKKISEETYALGKQRLEQHSADAREGKLEMVKNMVEKPKVFMSIVSTLVGYVTLLKDLYDLVDDIYGRIPEEAKEVPPELEVIISEIESLEIKDSTYALIGGFSSDLFNDLYSAHVFSVVARFPDFSVSSLIKRAEGRNQNAGNRNDIILESAFGDLELKIATDMKSTFLASLSGDVHEGFRETLRFSLPEKNAQMELLYQHVNGGICVGIASRPTLVFSFSGILGMKAFSAGLDVSFDATSKTLQKFDIAAGFDNAEYSASLAIAKKCDEFRGSLARKLWPGTTVGAEATYERSSGKTSVWVGASHQYTDALLLKAKISGDCNAAAAAVQYKFKERCSLSLNCLVEHKDELMQPKFGICFSF